MNFNVDMRCYCWERKKKQRKNNKKSKPKNTTDVVNDSPHVHYSSQIQNNLEFKPNRKKKIYILLAKTYILRLAAALVRAVLTNIRNAPVMNNKKKSWFMRHSYMMRVLFFGWRRVYWSQPFSRIFDSRGTSHCDLTRFSQYLPKIARGKSLRIVGYHFLPNWQPPLIFVRFISNF